MKLAYALNLSYMIVSTVETYFLIRAVLLALLSEQNVPERHESVLISRTKMVVRIQLSCAVNDLHFVHAQCKLAEF